MGLFAATVFGAVIGTAIGFVAGASPLWAAPRGNHRIVLGHDVPRPAPPARAASHRPSNAPVPDPPSYRPLSVFSRPDAEPATAPVAAVTPLLATIQSRVATREGLVHRVEALAQSGVPIIVEQRWLPEGTDPLVAPDFTGSSRILPYERDGHVIGVQVFGRVEDSFFGKAGARSGDVLLAVNGVPFSDPDAVLGALRFDTRVLVLELARAGQQRVLVLRW